MNRDSDIDMRTLEGLELKGRYRLVEYLDEGGFGAVFRATQLAFGLELRPVAIKIGKMPMTESQARRTFGDALQMARLADRAPTAELRESFVTVHEVGFFDIEPIQDHPYVAMELVRGGSLKTQLRHGPFPLTRAIDYFDRVLAAVTYMHASEVEGKPKNPVIHRDLKPGNVLVARGPDIDIVKVTDFGLAVDVDLLLGWAASGGDLSYLAPESFSEELCSPRTDVYMLALTFYELVTGHNPFSVVGAHLGDTSGGDHDELKRCHLDARHGERFARLEEDVELRSRPALIEVIRTALASDPDSRRYRNAGELKQAWDEAKLGDRRQPSDERPWETVRRLLSEGNQAFSVGSVERGDRLLEDAMRINRDPGLVPDRLVSGKLYRKRVERLLELGDRASAEALAAEGWRRRTCQSTLLGMAAVYEARSSGSAGARKFHELAKKCGDDE